MRRPQLLSSFSVLESLETRAMLSASVHCSGEAVHHHRGGSVHVELKHANSPTHTTGKIKVSDDKAGHDANDDKGVDPAGHDANDDHGVDATEVHQHRRGK